jgi:hypothetical protein
VTTPLSSLATLHAGGCHPFPYQLLRHPGVSLGCVTRVCHSGVSPGVSSVLLQSTRRKWHLWSASRS